LGDLRPIFTLIAISNMLLALTLLLPPAGRLHHWQALHSDPRNAGPGFWLNLAAALALVEHRFRLASYPVNFLSGHHSGIAVSWMPVM
jgi:hypothetical protein